VIKEEIISKNKYDIKNIITSKFKDKFWEDKELEGKWKLRYYLEVLTSLLLIRIIFTSAKKKNEHCKDKN